MKPKIVYYLLITAGLMQACGKEATIGQQPMDTTPPAPPTVTDIENLNGAAVIHYTIPKDDDLLFVQARYTINGVVRESKASYYDNKLKVDGFGKTEEYPVTLYSVDRSQNLSTPVTIKVNPKTSPVELVFQSLKLLTTFGGMGATWINESESNIIVSFLQQDSTGDYRDASSFYSNSKNGVTTLRGYDTIPYHFAVYIRDRWDNYSDTLFTTITPVFETEIDRGKFQENPLDGDCTPHSAYPVNRLWNRNINTDDSFVSGDDGMPKSVTFDLGVTALLSRFKWWQRNSAPVQNYGHANVKHLQVWGRESYPDVDGSWEGWTLLTDVENYKPSGKPMGENTPEDLDYMKAGDEHEFPIEMTTVRVRYIRLKFLEAWDGGEQISMGEIAFWGQPVK